MDCTFDESTGTPSGPSDGSGAEEALAEEGTAAGLMLAAGATAAEAISVITVSLSPETGEADTF
jgi:hypothetical protein